MTELGKTTEEIDKFKAEIPATIKYLKGKVANLQIFIGKWMVWADND